MKTHRLLTITTVAASLTSLRAEATEISGTPSAGDYLGASCAAGDFDGDGYDDVAIGAPGESVNGDADAGAVNVIYGSSTGLTTTGNEIWHEDDPGTGAAAVGDEFGTSLAVGDFNQDGYDDLAVGVPYEDVALLAGGVAYSGGAVDIFYGSASGFTSAAFGRFTQDSNSGGTDGVPETDDWFGWAVAAGDFDDDGYDDLAVGVPGEDIGFIDDAGATNVFYGSSSGVTATGSEIWTQAPLEGTVSEVDWFGYALTTGDFDGDDYVDLAVGVPSEVVGSSGSAGAVNVIYGSSGGLTTSGNKVWHQDVTGVEGDADDVDFFGWALASGDFDDDGYDDLAIGAPNETICDGAACDTSGVVNVLYGSSSGITATGDQVWTQTDLAGTPEDYDGFGHSLAAGDFDGDGRDDLAIGVPDEGISSATDEEGVVNVVYGTSSGLDTAGNQMWSQDPTTIQGAAERGDNFGWALAAGDFDGNGRSDLCIGVPYEDVGTTSDAGAVNVIYGNSSSAGLTDANDDLFNQ